ncbi:hypothetical protein K439DRAFT_1628488 [Ramaria rubella]|nr:hypothetical protein K439DRAFT_1628488 [Ramaria rubella]
MAEIVNKWAAGPDYGPVLEPTDLYLLQTELELHPILKGLHQPSFVFNLSTGHSGMFNVNDRERDLPFTKKKEPATLPRVTEIIIITRSSPWCTTIRKPDGVTVEDLCGGLWSCYGEEDITEAEYASIPPRIQEQMRRTAAWTPFSPGGVHPGRSLRRCAYLKNLIYFDHLEKEDTYCKMRLGFTAPNVFVMHLTS